MRVFRSLEEVRGGFGPCALTIGNFDGVHTGHRKIMRRVVEVAGAHGWKASVLTFNPHPAKVVAPDRAPRLLTTPERRAELMAEEGIEQVLILPFTVQLSSLAPEVFVRDILERDLNARAVLVGANFRFGHRHAGGTALLSAIGEEDGFVTEIVPAVSVRGRVTSSSQVRTLVASGVMHLAARMLERPFAMQGAVVPGHGIGSRQTVPTLNLAPETDLLPATGVYATHTLDLDGGREWPSVTNVGCRPTFDGDALTIETFLLEPLQEGSPRRIRVEFLRRLREERKFGSPDLLKTQILRDVSRAQAYFRRTGRLRKACALRQHASRGTVEAQE